MYIIIIVFSSSSTERDVKMIKIGDKKNETWKKNRQLIKIMFVVRQLLERWAMIAIHRRNLDGKALCRDLLLVGGGLVLRVIRVPFNSTNSSPLIPDIANPTDADNKGDYRCTFKTRTTIDFPRWKYVIRIIIM